MSCRRVAVVFLLCAAAALGGGQMNAEGSNGTGAGTITTAAGTITTAAGTITTRAGTISTAAGTITTAVSTITTGVNLTRIADEPSAVPGTVGNPARQEERHPQQELLDRPSGVPVHTLGAATAAGPAFVERLRGARRVAVAGSPEQEEEIFFGRLDGAVIDPRGRVFVLDSQRNQVAMLRLDSSVAATFGRRGKGPGEFSSADAIALDAGSGRVFVGDRDGRIHVFSAGGDEPELIDTVRAGRSLPEALCIIDGSLAVGSRDFPDGLVRLLADDGTVREAFGGVLYHSPHAFVNRTVSAFAMACDANESMVFLAVSALGEVRAVQRATGVKWIAVADEFQPPPITFRNGRIRLATPFEQTIEQMISVARVAEFVVAQRMTWVMHRDRSVDAQFTTYVIDAQSGESWVASEELPRILAADDTHLVTEEPGENPFIGIYELGAG
jgi:hypothetical protein